MMKDIDIKEAEKKGIWIYKFKECTEDIVFSDGHIYKEVYLYRDFGEKHELVRGDYIMIFDKDKKKTDIIPIVWKVFVAAKLYDGSIRACIGNYEFEQLSKKIQIKHN